MKKTGIIVLIFWLLDFSGLFAQNREISFDIFPEMSGWQKKGEPEMYSPDNLFEYINGAAEVYLSYDFQKLITLSYSNPKQQSFTIDIYQHSNSNNGFGIYSQEKPQEGDFLKIGTQGYYEQGILNFFKDRVYVKLSAFDLKEIDRPLLEKIARLIDRQLPGEPLLPKTVSCFPSRGKIENSERFILQNFLGHSFLHSAFVADYLIKDEKFQIFIIETTTSQKADTILERYLAFLKRKGIEHQQDNSGAYRFSDPYYRSSGTMNLKKNSRFIWGFFSNDIQKVRTYLEAIEQNLKNHQLIR
ncbi:MAG: hypothetical protein KAS65_05460 [Candidatus Aminicenantes bacterium]|nr:hypothetical protein [Candidatus Aminicenantes bacterium]